MRKSATHPQRLSPRWKRISARNSALSKCLRNSHARPRFVRPFQLDRVTAERPCFPRANVADLTVAIVVPSLAGHRIGDGFAKFVRGGGSERVDDAKAAGAPGTSGVRHDRIEN